MGIGRREALGLGIAATLEGCARQATPPAAIPLEARELGRTLDDLDRTVATIRARKPDPKRFGIREDETSGHDLIAKSLATMSVVATFRELPEETRIHPEVQRRMWRALPDIADSTLETADFLDGLTTEQRKRIDERLARDANFPMRILEKLDEDAGAHDIPASHRARLRTLGAHVTWKLKNQGATAVIEEIVSKMNRIQAHRGVDIEIERAVAAKVAEARLFGMPTDPPPAPTPQTEQNEPDAPGVLRARFRTSASFDAVQKAACTLDAKLQLDGKVRPLDLADCAMTHEDALRGRVRADGQTYVLEIDVPPGASAEATEELKGALRETAKELRRRGELTASAAPTSSTASPEPDRPITVNRSHASTRALIVAGIAWGVALGFGIPGIVLIAQNDIGGAFLLTPASIAAVVGIVALIAAAVMAAGGD
jgi:hypothetical protein